MSVLKLNLEELLENMNNKTSLVDSELSGGKGKKRLKKPKRKSKKSTKGKKNQKGFLSNLFGSNEEAEDSGESEYIEDTESSMRPGMGMGRGMGRGMCIKLKEEVEQLKDVIANLEEKILMLENRLDNL
jgi:hypothetical protein